MAESLFVMYGASLSSGQVVSGPPEFLGWLEAVDLEAAVKRLWPLRPETFDSAQFNWAQLFPHASPEEIRIVHLDDESVGVIMPSSTVDLREVDSLDIVSSAQEAIGLWRHDLLGRG